MQTIRDHSCQQPTQFAALADAASLLAVAPSERLHALNLTETAQFASGLATWPWGHAKEREALAH